MEFLGGKVKPFYHATTMTRGAEGGGGWGVGGGGVSSLSFNQNYIPNCNIQEMRGGSIFKIIPHCVTYRALIMTCQAWKKKIYNSRTSHYPCKPCVA